MIARLFALAVVLAACGGKKAANDPQAELTSIAQAACACTDQACIDEIDEKLSDFKIRYISPADGTSLSKAEVDKLDPTLQKIGECRDKATGGGAPHAHAAMAAHLAETGKLADRMCACADRACADKVASDMTTWAAAQPPMNPDAMPTPEETKQAQAITERFAACITKAMSAPPPSPPSPPSP